MDAINEPRLSIQDRRLVNGVSGDTHMRVLEIIGGILILGLAVVLCVPVATVGWAAFSSFTSGASVHSDFILSFGTLRADGWRMWLLLGGLALVAAVLAMLGIHVLSSRQDDR